MERNEQLCQPGRLGIPQPLLPLGANWNAPRYAWADQYPAGVAPGLIYPEARTERFLEIATEHFPDRVAIRFFRTEWTYRELLGRVRQIAGRLAGLGIEPGDRVLSVLPNCPETVALWFAVQYLGAQMVHGSPLHSARDLVFLARTSQAKAVIGIDVVLNPVLEMVRHCNLRDVFVVSLARHLPIHLRALYRLRTFLAGRHQVGRFTSLAPFDSLYSGATPLARPALSDPNLPAVLQPTGGTTGVPKLAILTHKNLVTNCYQGYVMTGRRPEGESILGILPFFHSYGATTVMLAGIGGAATMTLLPRFDPVRTAKMLEEAEITVAPMVPFMFAELLAELKRHPRRLDKLAFCASGGSAIEPTLLNEFMRHTGAIICEGYGLSECSPLTHTNAPHNLRVGSIGIPVPDTEIRLVDVETGTYDVGPGELGELWIRGPQVMQGYYQNPEETERAFTDGWLRTGDIASMDGDGFFRIVDRKKDMIISAGLNIFPSEVEAVLAEHPAVARCAVVGEPDDRRGQRVVAWVVPRSGTDINAPLLLRHCRARLSQYKVPREFRACAELPTNFLGKVRRVELRGKKAA